MRKGRAVLKKVVDGLRCLPVALAIGAMGVGILAPIIGLPVSLVYGGKAEKYAETAIYQQLKDEDIKQVEAAYENGEIGEYDYNEQRKYFDSKDYVKELIYRDYEENKEFQGYLKTSKIAGLATVITPAVALGYIGLAVLYSHNVDTEEAWRRLSYNDYGNVVENKPKKVKKSKEKEIVYVYEEEDLPNIEDSYYKE